jgi:hypothetical protein
VLTFPIYKDFLLHDYTLSREAAAFRTLKHPAGTSRISLKQYLGLYLGNGNHCDYFVGELRRYSGEPQAIRDFYSGLRVADLGVNLMFIDASGFSERQMWALPSRLDVLSQWLKFPLPEDARLYLLYIFDIDLDPGWDLRCS